MCSNSPHGLRSVYTKEFKVDHSGFKHLASWLCCSIMAIKVGDVQSKGMVE